MKLILLEATHDKTWMLHIHLKTNRIEDPYNHYSFNVDTH